MKRYMWSITETAYQWMHNILVFGQKPESKDMLAGLTLSAAAPAPVIRKEGGIAFIDITGMMMQNPGFIERVYMGATDTIAIGQAIKDAGSDASIQRIALLIDSPGGTVSGTAELGDIVSQVGSVKPVSAYVSDVCASAAYWVASQASTITANKTAVVGSIGVRMAMYDYSAAYEQAGVKVIPIDTGKFKSAGLLGTEVTADQIQMYQDIIDEHFGRFSDAVMTGRGMTDKQFGAVKDAQIFSATQAVGKNLIDGVNTLQGFVDGLVASCAPKGRNTKTSRARLALLEI